VSSPGMLSRSPGPRCRRHWTLLAVLACCVAGCDLPGRPKASDRYVPAQTERKFNVLFQQNCVGCHGADGKFGPAPLLNDKLFLALIPDTELRRVIAAGRTGTLMPAFAAAEGGPLTAEQVEVLADGIKTRWGPVDPVPRGTPPYLLEDTRPDRAGAGSIEEGLRVFARACASCHGDHGQGGQSDRKSVGAINDPDFLTLISDQALRRFVITGRHDLGMPHYAEPTGRPTGFQPLSRPEVTSVVALLAHWRKGGSVQRKGN
jgi:cytochrome c oxidase cbb3-type subunit 3